MGGVIIVTVIISPEPHNEVYSIVEYFVYCSIIIIFISI